MVLIGQPQRMPSNSQCCTVKCYSLVMIQWLLNKCSIKTPVFSIDIRHQVTKPAWWTLGVSYQGSPSSPFPVASSIPRGLSWGVWGVLMSSTNGPLIVYPVCYRGLLPATIWGLTFAIASLSSLSQTIIWHKWWEEFYCCKLLLKQIMPPHPQKD